MRLPYTPVEFTKSGDPADRTQFDTAIKMISGASDVIMVAPGWNNDMPSGERLFSGLTDNIDILMSGRPPSGRSLAVVGLQWPSKQWGSDAADTSGHGAGLGDDVAELIARIGLVVDDPATRQTLQELAPKLETDADTQARFLGVLRGLLPPPDAVSDDDALPGELLSGTVPEVIGAVQDARAAAASQIGTGQVPADAAGLPPGFVPDPLAAGTAAAGFHFPKINPMRALTDVLNTTTFYVMKDRAGNVGTRGVAALIDAVAAANTGARVHLAGHSFGARVVSAAAAAANSPLSSVSLLQGAYSHRGLAAADPSIQMPEGAFRRALTSGFLQGPMIVTYTHNDKAVGLAYAIASRLARQVAANVGDAGDPYGGIGANGAVGTDEAIAGDLGDQNATYTLQTGRVHNLHADNFVHSHGDVTNPAVANAVLAAITTVGP